MKTRKRLHPVTLWGGLMLIVSGPLRLALAQTDGWLDVSNWLVGPGEVKCDRPLCAAIHSSKIIYQVWNLFVPTIVRMQTAVAIIKSQSI